MSRARADRTRHNDEPFSALNITPLIDVMLVLLIMLIVTIPGMTHKVPVDLPQGDSGAPPGVPHRLDITADGSLLWDGAWMTDAQLPARLAAGVAKDRALLIQTDAAARYARFDAVLATVKRAGVTKLAFVGNERMKIH